MNDSNTILRIKLDLLAGSLQMISEKVRYLLSPLSAIRLYTEDIMEDPEYIEIKARLVNLYKASDKCIIIARELVELTRPYFKSRLSK